MFDGDKFILSINYSRIVPILIDNTKNLVIKFENLNEEDKAYNLTLKMTLPDGIDIDSSEIMYTSKYKDNDNNTLVEWINIKDLSPMEVDYTFSASLKCNSTFTNGDPIPFDYSFPNISISGEIDTMPRGDLDAGNEKFYSLVELFFKSIRYEIKLDFPKKVLKGAGLSLSDTNYANVFEVKYTIINSIESSNLNTVSIDLQDGIRYTNNFLASGADSSEFSNPIITSLTDESDKTFTRISFNNISLSPSSITTIIFYVAVWNRYENNTGNIINHGTNLFVKGSLIAAYENLFIEESFAAMDILITKSSNKTITDVSEDIGFSLYYKLGQYYDLNDISIIDNLPDGIEFINSSYNDYTITKNPDTGISTLDFTIGNKLKNSFGLITIDCVIKKIYTSTSLPIVSNDNFFNSVAISAFNFELSLAIGDSSGYFIYMNKPFVEKSILNVYYRDNSLKNSNIISPNDIVEFLLVYNASTIKAVQRDIYVSDYFPLSITDIENINYNYSGYVPPSISPVLVDPHGVTFFLGDVPSNSTTNISYKAPIDSLTSNRGDENLLKLQGLNSYNYSYSSRDQISLTPGKPNIILTKSVSGPNTSRIKIGEIYTYTVTISNTNNLGTEVDAFDFELKDTLSDYFTLNEDSISVTGTDTFNPYTISPSNIDIYINKLAPNESITLEYSVTINNNISPNLSIKTEASNTNPYSQVFNEALDNYQFLDLNKSVSTTIKAKNISINKTSNSSNLKVGSDIEYIIEVQIPEGTIAYDFQTKDILPSGQIYKGPAFKDGNLTEVTISDNTVFFQIEPLLDATFEAINIIYRFTATIENSNKAIGSLTSTETNRASSSWKLGSISGDTKSSSNNYTTWINHPNINLSLQGRNKSSNESLSPFITTYSNKLIQAVLIFSNNSLIHIKNGIIEIPIGSNYEFISVDSTSYCNASFDDINKKLVLTITNLNFGFNGYVSFTLKTIPNLKAGTSLNLEGICAQYYNDLSTTKIYSGEKSNILEVSLPPNISLLPFILDRLDDETLFKYSIKGSTNYIKNVLTNTGNGIDDYSIEISPVALDYSIYIDNIKLSDVPKNSSYFSSPDLLKNIEPNESKDINLVYFVPLDIPNDTIINFLVRLTSLTSPYPTKLVTNLDP